MTSPARTPTAIAEDALDQLEVCKETLRQLEALLWSIKTSTNDGFKIKLAELGEYVALDIGDLVENTEAEWRAELEDNASAGDVQ